MYVPPLHVWQAESTPSRKYWPAPQHTFARPAPGHLYVCCAVHVTVGTQLVHTLAPALLKNPGWQSEHDVAAPLAVNFPEGHCWHAVSTPSLNE